MTARFAMLYLLLATAVHANVITVENARAGTDEWQLASGASEEITGYASATSVAAGQTIRFYISTSDPAFTLEVFRMGWYGGRGGRRMTQAVRLTGVKQAIPPPEPVTGLVRCRWRESHSIPIPANWVSGVYVAKLTGSRGHQNYIIFTVRDSRRADLVFQNSVTTWQAYNGWGGKALYARRSIGAQATRVSFDRPYNVATGPADYLFRWEYDMTRFLEREGYDVTYITNIDTHADPATLLRGKAFLSVGHDEYWSWEMRANVEAARDAGVHLAFFAGNVCYWQMRLEDDGRTIVAHKETALTTDPLAIDKDPENDKRVTTKWRWPPVSRPEESMIGVMYITSPVDGDLTISNASHWVFAGTNLKNGDKLKGLLGYEVDAIQGASSPPNLVRLAHSPFTTTNGSRSAFSDMTIYTTAKGTIVFAAGSIQWSWGVDDFGPPERTKRAQPAAQQITRNVLN